MKAIKTKYLGPGNVRGSRVKATTGEKGQTIILSWSGRDDSARNHANAARALANKFGWTGELIGGGFPDGSMVWVFAQAPDRA